MNQCRKHRIKEKVLCSHKVFDDIKKYDYEYSETRKLPHNYILPTTTLIYGDNIALFNWRLPYHAIVISNKDMAEAYRMNFELLWKMSNN